MDQAQWQEYLSARGAVWEGDQAHFPDTPADLHLMDLSPLGSVTVTGPDSQKFLQGQLTCDLVNLPDSHSTLGAHCNPKGRMISAFRAIKHSQEDFTLLLPRGLATAARDAMAKYAVFFKTELADVAESRRWLGLQGKGVLKQAAQLLQIPQLSPGEAARFELEDTTILACALNERQLALEVPNEPAGTLWDKLTTAAEAAGYCHWVAEQVEAGIPQLHAATSEMFIPQMLNLHLLGGVSFKKGCYTGQEVVARMQYLGAAKRRMYRARCESGELPAPGSDIVTDDGKSIGNIVEACRSNEGIELLAVLTIGKVAEEAPLLLADGRPLQLQELPYDADADPLA
ncbi:CAF17-like 4Fe-4S cluster assembly/insertion protein YgfZ [Microbulbifer sediminum]|uniref:CAF17-like 4Fe-4S cluster assembly/insertion protein YgfZ n=1 Tax=Microbulbifer sediminum TaxID=2904250 RepID=UPI001F3CB09A|nr:folate-binding protein [Microbulbifer sediminum]